MHADCGFICATVESAHVAPFVMKAHGADRRESRLHGRLHVRRAGTGGADLDEGAKPRPQPPYTKSS